MQSTPQNELTKTPRETINRFFEYKNLSLSFVSGCALAAHFGVWIASLDWTSLPHSLLFVTSSPILIVSVRFILSARCINLASSPSLAESVASIIGFTGMALTMLDVKSDQTVTVFGDLAALLGAALFWGHLEAGKRLRSWMPLFMYTFPVTAICTILLMISTVLIEGTGVNRLFEWVGKEYILYILYLGFVPGLFGHTVINNVIKHLDPIIVSIFLLSEPVIGSFIGWIMGVSGIPGLWTWIGGTIVMTALFWIVVSETKTVQDHSRRAEQKIKTFLGIQ
eukprot:TRINITY_DN5840_c0_g1_i3.p1 TRINITY_DN5840_c0_g1~~TRINITY_DN5840_c0_g1_i3.p1  ORF type:complete len:281 (+),score=60.27 TRINITY_DN5840_c0_g1_i3:903-1745(+)